jgi:hypothetical protein
MAISGEKFVSVEVNHKDDYCEPYSMANVGLTLRENTG